MNFDLDGTTAPQLNAAFGDGNILISFRIKNEGEASRTVMFVMVQIGFARLHAHEYCVTEWKKRKKEKKRKRKRKRVGVKKQHLGMLRDLI